MRLMLMALWAAGVVQLAIFAANFYVPRKLRYRQGIAGAPLIIRQIFYVHAAYVVGVVLLFSVVTFAFAPELASGAGLGRFWAAAICVFWTCRVPLQAFYYDAALRRNNRLGDIAMLTALVFLSVTYGVAAVGVK